MIGIASDHAGYEVKKELLIYLENLGYKIKDYGTFSEDSVDYPDFAFTIGKAVADDIIDKGILICKTGIGMSIACNKVKKVRCAKVDTIEEAKLTREHNNANVLAVSAIKSLNELKEIVEIFLKTEFSNNERHINRINKITDYEVKNES
ncbi:MAG: RpiB/LacA/LacB family sugar-phosphate isomerase [Bacilli bacterium]|nr:RpiB/LacA/LacB family sugar-phosphate isomerase [Bacilli bacterium]